jgi:hypothetical protein
MNRNALVIGIGVSLAALLWVVAIWNTGDADLDDPSTLEPPPLPLAQPTAAPASPSAPPPDPELEPKPSEPEPAVEPAPEPAAQPATPEPVVLPPPTAEGPIDELKAQFAREPRPSTARELDAIAERAFVNPNIQPGLLDSVLCRQTICKVTVRWRPEHMIGYMAAYTILLQDFGPKVAIAPASADDAAGSRVVEMYLERRTTPPPLPVPAPDQK